MRSSVLRRLYKNQQPKTFIPVTARRSDPSKRSFHTSLPRPKQDDPTKGSEAASTHVYEEVANPPITESSFNETDEFVEHADGGPSIPSKPIDRSNYGSAARRAGRNIKKVKDIPALQIPQWFLETNVILREAISGHVNVRYLTLQELGKSSVEQDPPTTKSAAEDVVEGKDPGAALWTANVSQISPSVASVSDKNTETVKSNLAEERENSSGFLKGRKIYEIQSELGSYESDAEIMHEVSALVSAGLQLPSKQHTNDWTSSKSDILLSCPMHGGSFFLDELVKYLASVNGADLIRLDPQDIAEIGGSYLEEHYDTHSRSLSSLGYDAYRMTSLYAEAQDAAAEVEEDMDTDKNVYKSQPRLNLPGSFDILYSDNLGDILKSAFKVADSPSVSNSAPKKVFVDITKDLKISNFIETILGASDLKRVTKDVKNTSGSPMPIEELAPEAATTLNETQEEKSSPESTSSSSSLPPTEHLIVMVRDYSEINSTNQGSKVLEKLHEIVKSRRGEGQRVLVVGTSSSKDLMNNISRSGSHHVLSEPEFGPMRTIITPCNTHAKETLLESHEMRMALINMRNLQEMLRRLAPIPLQSDLVSKATLESMWLIPSEEQPVSHSSGVLAALGQGVLPLDYIHRVAMVTIGLRQGQEGLTPKHVVRAIRTLFHSDTAKLEWIEHFKKQEEMPEDNSHNSKLKLPPSESGEGRIKRLRNTCNLHEKKLLNGVVDADSIRITFADVQAPQETIAALKNLTSLSLVRPDAFKYGVLAMEKIPGLLLYGPPGTGKTLLAKAVAKESGATVLEVSGSDLNDMYVGEGEKNVKAVFSLAKKLAPCIVFIDEADAILGSRGGSSTRTAHRELINQFLREWDGMNDLATFIMVATNRPFDLDDACLRRLPRRLLVDLPTEEDREAILRIHLKDELLEPAISLPTLASQTPFYSGSDLKNLAVAAALSCVREEFEQATAITATNAPSADVTQSSPATKPESSTKTNPRFEYPVKRTLLRRHFARAMEEISASISEDMGSLNAIRKFDEEFGDRKGRRKKGRGYGFDTVKQGEKNRSDAARVRNR